MNWVRNTSLMTGLEDQIVGVENTLKGIDNIISVIDIINTTISDIVNIVNSVGTLPELDPNLTAIQAVQKTIKDYVENFMSWGLYLLPIFSTNINELKGGIINFNETIAESFTDPYDKNRPILTNTAYTAGIVVMFDSGLSGLSSIEETFKATQGLLSMFNIPAKEVRVSDIEIHSVTDDKIIQFTWTVRSSEDSVPADSYVIYRTDIETSRTLDIFFTENIINNANVKKVGVVFPQETLRFEDKNVRNGTQYVYIFIRYVGTTACKYMNSYVVEPNVRITSPITVACSNLKITKDINKDVVYSCMKKNISFDRIENVNKILCRNGTNVCSDLTNKKCKNDDGNSCISDGYTINKTRGYAKSGNAIPILNKRLYVSNLCKNGTNAQVCDGYLEEMIYNNGKDPNWQKLSVKTFLPKGFFEALDYLYSFVDMLAASAQKQDYALSLLGNEIAETGDVLKSSILQIRNVLENVLSILNISLPATYTLKIPTSVGGTDQFISSLKTASNGPVQNNEAFNTGFVIFYGSNDKAEVDLFYALFSMFF